jgi:hypothetical protein
MDITVKQSGECTINCSTSEAISLLDSKRAVYQRFVSEYRAAGEDALVRIFSEDIKKLDEQIAVLESYQ